MRDIAKMIDEAHQEPAKGAGARTHGEQSDTSTEKARSGRFDAVHLERPYAEMTGSVAIAILRAMVQGGTRRRV